MRWPFVSRRRHEDALAVAHADIRAIQARLAAAVASAERAEGMLVCAGRLIDALGPTARTRDLSAVRSAITEADRDAAPSSPPAPAEPAALDAVTPDVLAACRQFAYGDRRQESANRAYAYTLARKGADAAQILRALRLGDRAEDVA